MFVQSCTTSVVTWSFFHHVFHILTNSKHFFLLGFASRCKDNHLVNLKQLGAHLSLVENVSQLIVCSKLAEVMLLPDFYSACTVHLPTTFYSTAAFQVVLKNAHF